MGKKIEILTFFENFELYKKKKIIIIDFRILKFYESFEILGNFLKSCFPFHARSGLFTGKQ